jgi:hypothetical protein
MFWIKDDCSFLWNSFCYSSLEPLKLCVSRICAYFALSHGVVANFLWWWWMLGHLGNQITTFIHPLKMCLQDQSIKHKSYVEMCIRSLCIVGFFGQNRLLLFWDLLWDFFFCNFMHVFFQMLLQFRYSSVVFLRGWVQDVSTTSTTSSKRLKFLMLQMLVFLVHESS